MLIQHAKDITSNYGGKIIKDCVITVPAHYTQHERQALYDAAQLADVRVLTLIEGSAPMSVTDHVFLY
jgi:hypoxia up-regulated 1